MKGFTLKGFAERAPRRVRVKGKKASAAGFAERVNKLMPPVVRSYGKGGGLSTQDVSSIIKARRRGVSMADIIRELGMKHQNNVYVKMGTWALKNCKCSGGRGKA